MTGRVWLDGALLPRAEARVSIDDRGFLYGAACFETMRAYGGVVFRLDRHLDRLQAGLRAIGVALPNRDRLREAVTATLEANALTDARVRLTVSAGASDGRPGLEPVRAPTVLITAEQAAPGLAPARALVATSVRVDPARPLPFAKSANYLTSLLALDEARRAGYDQALVLDLAAEVVEAATANLFVVLDGVLVTPPLEAGPLPGVTREAVIESASQLGIRLEERALPLQQLEAASEAFLTNSIVELQPLAEVRAASALRHLEAPGPVTATLASAYSRVVSRECGRP